MNIEQFDKLRKQRNLNTILLVLVYLNIVVWLVDGIATWFTAGPILVQVCLLVILYMWRARIREKLNTAATPDSKGQV